MKSVNHRGVRALKRARVLCLVVGISSITFVAWKLTLAVRFSPDIVGGAVLSSLSFFLFIFNGYVLRRWEHRNLQ